MAEKKNTYRYSFDIGNRTVEVGITANLHTRQMELRREHPGGSSCIVPVGFGPVTRAEARQWLREMAAEGFPTTQRSWQAA